MSQEGKSFAIGLDLGGSSLKYALMRSDGELIWEGKRASKAKSSKQEIIQNLIEAAQEAQEKAAQSGIQIQALGVGTPGLVNTKLGIVLGGADNLAEWVQVPLASELSSALNLPVYVDNDANLMGFGEYAFGESADAGRLLFFTIGTGIGGAIFIDGDLYRGFNHAGNELGAVMMNYEGKEGYWEDFASTSAMVRQYLEKEDVPHAAHEVNGKFILDQYKKGEALATSIFVEHCRLIGYGISGFINIFNPEKIIIGGGISESGPEYIELVQSAAFHYAMDDCSRGVKIEAAKLGNKAGSMGAAYFALKKEGLV